ncbi:MarR family transcriptional regulator [Intrasporangium chromatireducens Q5-1]|uniref:MarR family transcriptional regulator n=1 Tax=Intrasporangium chromatireducens Q5-1 TaxID=584657 RepID=W9GKT9_9MICO|nr:MarR family transcriptional regulator [Intrasporangium chromatireducens]EWT06881.1 MarR family transcriptional regulator [Intrasporangium chromatireducens Q5-1]
MPDNTRGRRLPPGSASEGDADALVTSLLTASRTLVGVSARSLAEVEETVTVTQFRTLVVLAGHGAMTLVRLSRLLEVNSSTAQRQVDRLLGLGLVSRRENPEDRREVRVDLTAEGARIVSTVTRRRRGAIAAIVRRMPEGQRDALISALEAFALAAGEPLAEVDAAGRLGW